MPLKQKCKTPPKFVYKLSNYVVDPKSESKLYNYNKILNYYFYHYYIIMYIKILPMISVTVYSCTMKEIRILIHK